MRSLDVRAKIDLAKALEISQPSVSKALALGSVPEAWLYKVAYRTRRNVEWLRTGEGPEFIDEAVAENSEYGRTATAREVVEAMEHLDDEEQMAVRRFLDLMKRGDSRVIRHLIDQVELLDDLAATKRRKRPPPAPPERGGVVG